MLSGKYLIYCENNEVKEFNLLNNILIFEGQYQNKKRNGKGKEYDIGLLTFEGEYLNGKRNGKGIEYDYGNILFEGEYLNGKRWNGRLFTQKDSTVYILENGNDFFDDKLFIQGKRLYLIKKENGIRYYTTNNIYEIKNGKGYLKEYSYNIAGD